MSIWGRERGLGRKTGPLYLSAGRAHDRPREGKAPHVVVSRPSAAVHGPRAGDPGAPPDPPRPDDEPGLQPGNGRRPDPVHPTFWVPDGVWEAWPGGPRAKTLAALSARLPAGTVIEGYCPEGVPPMDWGLMMQPVWDGGTDMLRSELRTRGGHATMTKAHWARVAAGRRATAAKQRSRRP